MDLQADIAMLRAEVETLKALVTEFAASEAGGDGFGTDVGLPIVPVGGGAGAFQFDGDKITHCNFYAAHRIVELEDVEIGTGGADGTWYLNVDHDDLDNATVEKTAGTNDDDHTSIKLFTIEDGAITKDYRGMPFVPIYA